MGVKGFNINGQVVPYDYNYLENRPSILEISNDRKNDQVSVAGILGVAKSYYDARGDANNPTFTYGTSQTALDPDFNGVNIDCSSYVGLLLRGIPYNKSSYYNGDNYPYSDDDTGEDDLQGYDNSSDGDSVDPGYYAVNTKANDEENPWSVNPSIYKYPKENGYEPTPVRNAAQLGEWMRALGYEIKLMSDFSNIEPGDIIFWAKYERRRNGQIIYDEQGNPVYKQPNRFMHISHVAICYSKMDPPDDYTYGSEVGVTINSFNADRVRSYIDNTIYGGNADYDVVLSNNRWTIHQRGSSSSPIAVNLLTEMGIDVTINSGDTHSFVITCYLWDRSQYPYKHTTMEAADIPPYILNRTLEKHVPGEVVMVCRPDLGSVRPNVFTGDVSSLMDITSIEDFYRSGSFYLTEGITDIYDDNDPPELIKASGLPSGISSGLGYILDVNVNYNEHGKVCTVEQLLRDTRSNYAPVYRRYKYCLNNLPSEIGWSEWSSFAHIPSGGSANYNLSKNSSNDFDFKWTPPVLIDNTLTEEGQAADSKKVGDELTDISGRINTIASTTTNNASGIRIIKTTTEAIQVPASGEISYNFTLPANCELLDVFWAYVVEGRPEDISWRRDELTVYDQSGHFLQPGYTYQIQVVNLQPLATPVVLSIVYSRNDPISLPELTDLRVGTDGVTYPSARQGVLASLNNKVDNSKVFCVELTATVGSDGILQNSSINATFSQISSAFSSGREVVLNFNEGGTKYRAKLVKLSTLESVFLMNNDYNPSNPYTSYEYLFVNISSGGTILGKFLSTIS